MFISIFKMVSTIKRVSALFSGSPEEVRGFMKNLTASLSQKHGLIIPYKSYEASSDLASVLASVVSNDLAFFLAFLSFTPEHVNYFHEALCSFTMLKQ